MEKEKKGVRLEHISKIYKDPKTGKEFYAVQDTTLDIEAGTFVTLLGPSGCGKTTCGRTLVKLYDATSGTGLFEGKDVSKLKGKELLGCHSVIMEIDYATGEVEYDLEG